MKLLNCWVWGLVALILVFPMQGFCAPENKDCPDCPKEEKEVVEKVKLDDVFVHAFGGGAIKYTPTSVIVDVDKYVKAGSVERIEDILKDIAGIDVMKGAGVPDPQAVILMRGLDDSRFVVAMDGRPITGSTGKTNTSIDWSSITLADVEKIEIIRGGASAKYEAAEGGVINLIMKKGKKRDTLMPRITYTQDYSQIFDYSDPVSHSERLTVDGGIGELTYFLNFGHKSAEGYLKNNQYRGNDYSARFTYSFPWEGLLALSYKGAEYDRENPVVNDPNFSLPDLSGQILPHDPDYPTVPVEADTVRNTGTTVSFNVPGLINHKERKVDNWDVSYEQPMGDSTLKLYYYKSKNEEDDWYVKYDKTKSPTYIQDYRGGDGSIERHRGGGIYLITEPWENNSLTLGYTFKRTEAEDMVDIYRIHGGYFEDLWILNDVWTVKSGLRVSRLRHATYPTNLGGGPKVRHYFREWFILPKFALTYNIRPDLNLTASVARDYDIPGC